jgi:hypothetical protein
MIRCTGFLLLISFSALQASEDRSGPVASRPVPASFQNFDHLQFPVFLGSFREDSDGSTFSQKTKPYIAFLPSSDKLHHSTKNALRSIVRIHHGQLGIISAFRAPPVLSLP